MDWPQALNKLINENSLDKRIEISFEFIKLFSTQSSMPSYVQEKALRDQIFKLKSDLEEAERTIADLYKKMIEDTRRRASRQMPKKKRKTKRR